MLRDSITPRNVSATEEKESLACMPAGLRPFYPHLPSTWGSQFTLNSSTTLFLCFVCFHFSCFFSNGFWGEMCDGSLMSFLSTRRCIQVCKMEERRRRRESANLSGACRCCRYISRLLGALGRLSLLAVSQGRHCRTDLTDPLVHFFGSLGRQVQTPLCTRWV